MPLTRKDIKNYSKYGITVDQLISKLMKLKNIGLGDSECWVEYSNDFSDYNIYPVIQKSCVVISNYPEVSLEVYPKILGNKIEDSTNNVKLFDGFVRYDLTFKKSYHFPQLLQGASIDPEWGLNWKDYYRNEGELRSDITIHEGEKIEFYLNSSWSGWDKYSPFFEYERPHFFFTKNRKYMYGSAGTESNPNPLSINDIIDILDGIEDSI